MSILSRIWPSKWLGLLLLVFAIVGVSQIYFWLTDDFRISNINYRVPYSCRWDLPLLSDAEKEQMGSLLKQRFVYLKKGGQSYAFQSEDGAYVLKFFKYKGLKPNWIVQSLPAVYPITLLQQRDVRVRKRRIAELYNAYLYAYKYNRVETGILYMQLLPSEENLPVLVVDKMGFEHHLNLGDYAFILQEKCYCLQNLFSDAMERHDLAGILGATSKIFDMCLNEYSRGFYDSDKYLERNVGLAGERAVHFDAGHFEYDLSMRHPGVYEEYLLKVGNHFANWFSEHYPQSSSEIAAGLELQLSDRLGHPVHLGLDENS